MNGVQAVLQLVSREPPKEEDLEGQKDSLRRRLLAAKQELAFSIFQENLRKQLEASGHLKINTAAVERLSVATP